MECQFHCQLPGAGTLDCAPPQSELDQPRVLPAQRRRERRFFNRDGGGSGVSGRISAAVMNEEHPTSNNQHPTSNELQPSEAIGCSALNVGCWMFSQFSV